MRVHATLMMSNGDTIQGAFFVASGSALHVGRERVKEVLSGEAGFFPFELHVPGGPRTALYNRDHVTAVALGTNDEAQLDSGYAIATRRAVTMRLSTGRTLTGSVTVYRPEGHDRLSDFARSPERFRYLETADNTFLVNVRHLVELVEENPQP